jgi:hypothetical protein
MSSWWAGLGENGDAHGQGAGNGALPRSGVTDLRGVQVRVAKSFTVAAKCGALSLEKTSFMPSFTDNSFFP